MMTIVKKSNRRASGGFTLIELLIAVCVICLLIGFLTPSYYRMVALAKRAQCQSNQRSLHFGWVAFAEDNGGVMISAGTRSDVLQEDNDGVRWSMRPDWALDPRHDYNLDGAKSREDCAAVRTLCNSPSIMPHLSNFYSHMDFDEQQQRRELAIKHGALFPYVGALDVYRCPTPCDSIHRVYKRHYSVNMNLNGGWKEITCLPPYTHLQRFIDFTQDFPQVLEDKSGIDQDIVGTTYKLLYTKAQGVEVQQDPYYLNQYSWDYLAKVPDPDNTFVFMELYSPLGGLERTEVWLQMSGSDYAEHGYIDHLARDIWHHHPAGNHDGGDNFMMVDGSCVYYKWRDPRTLMR